MPRKISKQHEEGMLRAVLGMTIYVYFLIPKMGQIFSIFMLEAHVYLWIPFKLPTAGMFLPVVSPVSVWPKLR